MCSRFGRIPSLPTRTSHICMVSRAPLPRPRAGVTSCHRDSRPRRQPSNLSLSVVQFPVSQVQPGFMHCNDGHKQIP